MALKSLLFDACDVLYHRPRRGEALAGFLAPLGLSPPPPRDPMLAAAKRRAMVGDLSNEGFRDALLGRCGVTDPVNLARGRDMLAASQADVEFFDGVGETLPRLKALGLKLGIVTNTYETEETKRRWFDRVAIADVWDAFAASAVLGVAKPDAGIYLAALEALDVAPDAAAFVGHEAVELEGAKAVGLTTIAFNRDDETVTADHVVDRFPELLDLVTDLA